MREYGNRDQQHRQRQPASALGARIARRHSRRTRSTVSGNIANGNGGGIFASNAALTTSTVSGNTAFAGGGGIFVNFGASLTRSTVSGNTAGIDGAGIKADTANLTNSTVSGNAASRNGGGVLVTQGGDILNSTIVLNRAGFFGGGVQVLDGTVRVKNTIIANNVANNLGRDVLGLFDSQGHNLIRDPNSGNANTDFTDPLNRDVLGVDPRLGALADNGGPTKTHALLAGSRAIDRGLNAGAPATDQRGVARPRDGDANGSLIVDIGAFER